MKKARKALVTGGSRGIGRGIAIELAKAGYDLTIGHWHDEEEAEKTAARIRLERGRKCTILTGDLANSETTVQMVEAALHAMGQIDLLVNNAGVFHFHSILDMPDEALNRLFHVNFRAPLLMMREVSRHMIEAGIKGCILNVTSSKSERAYPGDAVYGGLKAGLKRATESAALDLAPYGIRVNCIAPGAMVRDEGDSPADELGRKIPLGRRGTPEDIGHIAVWLASDQAAYMTGISVRADGGLILPGMPEHPGKLRNEWHFNNE
jgi:glucose 1-dehydrogenase